MKPGNIALVVIFAVAAMVASAKTVTITTGGNVAAAIAEATSDSDPAEVVLGAGDYTVASAITLSSAITIRGVTGDPSDVRVSGNDGSFVLFTLSSDGAVVRDLTIRNVRGVANKPGCAAYVTAGTLRNCVIRNCQLNPRTLGVVNLTGSSSTMTACVVTNNLTGGLGDFDATNGGIVIIASGAVVEDSYIGYNSLCRTYYYTYALPNAPVTISGGTLRNCVIHKNMMSASGGVKATGGTVEDCIIWNNRCPGMTDNRDVWDGKSDKFTGCRARIAINANCTAVSVMPPNDWFGFGMSESSVYAGGTVSFEAAAGEASYEWNFGDGQTTTTSSPVVDHAYSTAGVYFPTVTYGGRTYVAPESVHVFGSPHVVSTYADLVDATDNAINGMTVNVAAGTYVPTKMICVFNGATIAGIGLEQTIFNGNQNGIRAFYLNHPAAVVENMTFRNFKVAMRGPGVTAAVMDGLVSNCVFRSSLFSDTANKISSTASVGGGGSGKCGVITHCVFSNITANCKNTIGTAVAVKVSDGGILANSLIRDCHGSSLAKTFPVQVLGGLMINSTVVENDGCLVGGICGYDYTTSKVGTGEVRNCVLAANSSYYAVANNDIHPDTTAQFLNCASVGETAINASCVASTLAALFNDYLAHDYSPALGSVLVNGGATWVDAEATDLAGNARVQGSAIDIGCYEMNASQVSLSFTPYPESVFIGGTVTFTGVLTGIDDQSGLTWEWDFNNDGVVDSSTGPVVTNVFGEYGSQTVSLTVKDGHGALVATKVRDDVVLVNPKTLYVQADSPDPREPYESWEHAAHGFIEAYEVSDDGAEIVVSNGTYSLPGNGLTIEKSVKVRSRTGRPEDVVFIGADAVGADDMTYLFSLKNPGATLESITVDGTMTRNCLYIWGVGGTVTNSIIRNGYSYQADFYIPGCFIGGEAGIVSHCVITNCNRNRQGMRNMDGVISNRGRLSNCLVAGNRSILATSSVDDEAFIFNGGIIDNCTIVGNVYTNGQFIYQSGTGKLINTLCSMNMDLSDGSFASPVDGFGTVAGCVIDPDADLTFADWRNGDWHVKSASPASNAGTKSFHAFPSLDIDGKRRRVGGRVDAGCYESTWCPYFILQVE